MMDWVADVGRVVAATLRDALPIVLILMTFQLFVLRRPLPNMRRTLLGLAYVLAGLAIFLLGLEQAIFPLGKTMAAQLTAPDFLGTDGDRTYGWVYAFAFAIGFSTTMAEPAVIAVALKAQELSAGAIDARGLRIAVALGVAIGIGLGTYRIVVGTPLYYFIMAGYAMVLIQTLFAPKLIVALAYDSGGVTTSTVTVPLLAGLGLGLAESVPGRSPIMDGFGLIAFASLFPMITVMAYAQLAELRARGGGSTEDPSASDPTGPPEEQR